jgi:hypothetical protein
VTSLGSRTPHQPGKLQNVSKNEYVSTPFNFFVNKISTDLSTSIFNQLRKAHSPVTQFGAIIPSVTPRSEASSLCCGDFLFTDRSKIILLVIVPL